MVFGLTKCCVEFNYDANKRDGLFTVLYDYLKHYNLKGPSI